MANKQKRKIPRYDLYNAIFEERKDKGFSVFDLLALLMFLVLGAYFVFFARFGVQNADESTYYTFSHRLMLGDAPVVNEWSMTALSFPFQYLPLRLFIAVTGGTDGCILFMRYVYVAVKMCVFALIYLALRRYGIWSLLAALVYTGFTATGTPAIDYYNIAQNAVLLIALLLSTRRTTHPAALILSGFLFACAVIAEPLCALYYALYCLAVPIAAIARKKRGEPGGARFALLGGKSWGLITLGAVVCAGIYLVFLLKNSSFSALISSIPELLTDSTFSSGGNSALKLIKWDKIRQFLSYSGIPAVILTAVTLAGAPLIRRRFMKYRPQYFAVCCAVVAFATVSFFIGCKKVEQNRGLFFFKPIPIAVFGLVCYILTEKKDRRILAFLSAGALLSAAIDIPSQTMLGGGCIVADVPAVLALRSLLRELTADFAENTPETKTKKRAKQNGIITKERIPAAVCAILAAATLIGGEIYYDAVSVRVHAIEQIIYRVPHKNLDETIDRGPLKGVVTVRFIKELVDGSLEDLDLIKSSTDGPLYIAGFCPWFYIYAQLPYSACSASYVDRDSRDRQLRYWKTFPEKNPAYIYIPLYDCRTYFTEETAEEQTIGEKVEFFRKRFNTELTKGRQGYFLRVDGLKSADAD
ncbi:MAG: hypothetical protein IK118_09795 [Clostridia bacterium]|nr:hypothetical protein [Clostridia bacterium]